MEENTTSRSTHTSPHILGTEHITSSPPSSASADDTETDTIYVEIDQRWINQCLSPHSLIRHQAIYSFVKMLPPCTHWPKRWWRSKDLLTLIHLWGEEALGRPLTSVETHMISQLNEAQVQLIVHMVWRVALSLDPASDLITLPSEEPLPLSEHTKPQPSLCWQVTSQVRAEVLKAYPKYREDWERDPQRLNQWIKDETERRFRLFKLQSAQTVKVDSFDLSWTTDLEAQMGDEAQVGDEDQVDDEAQLREETQVIEWVKVAEEEEAEDDFGEVLEDDFGEVLEDDFGEVLEDDFGEVPEDDFGEVPEDDFGEVPEVRPQAISSEPPLPPQLRRRSASIARPAGAAPPRLSAPKPSPPLGGSSPPPKSTPPAQASAQVSPPTLPLPPPPTSAPAPAPPTSAPAPAPSSPSPAPPSPAPAPPSPAPSSPSLAPPSPAPPLPRPPASPPVSVPVALTTTSSLEMQEIAEVVEPSPISVKKSKELSVKKTTPPSLTQAGSSQVSLEELLEHYKKDDLDELELKRSSEKESRADLKDDVKDIGEPLYHSPPSPMIQEEMISASTPERAARKSLGLIGLISSLFSVIITLIKLPFFIISLPFYPLLMLGRWIKKRWLNWKRYDGRSKWERCLSEEAGQTGPLELVLSEMRWALKMIHWCVGLRILPFIYLIDQLWSVITNYIKHIFSVFMALRSARRIRRRIQSGILVNETASDLQDIRSYLSHLLCISGHYPEADFLEADFLEADFLEAPEHKLPLSSSSSPKSSLKAHPSKPTPLSLSLGNPLILAILIRSKIDDARRDLRWTTRDEVKRGFFAQVSGWIVGLIPNPLELLIPWKDCFILAFKLHLRRREVREIYGELLESYYQLLSEFNHSTQEVTDLSEVLKFKSYEAVAITQGGYWSTHRICPTPQERCRGVLNRLLILSIRSTVYAQPKKWRPLDWIDELSTSKKVTHAKSLSTLQRAEADSNEQEKPLQISHIVQESEFNPLVSLPLDSWLFTQVCHLSPHQDKTAAELKKIKVEQRWLIKRMKKAEWLRRRLQL